MFTEQTEKTELPQYGGWDGRVHMTRPGVPPRPVTVEGRDAGTSLVETAPTKFVEPSPWSLPLAPHDAAQFPTKPLIKVLEARFHFR